MAATSVAALQFATAQSVQAAPRAPCIAFANLKTWSVTGQAADVKSPEFRTTANCVDINFGWGSTSTSESPKGRVRVCFTSTTCQSTWKNYNGDTAPDTIVVASNVSDNTRYRMEFDFAASSYGSEFVMKIYG